LTVVLRTGHRTAYARKHAERANKNEHGVAQTLHLLMVVNHVMAKQNNRKNATSRNVQVC